MFRKNGIRYLQISKRNTADDHICFGVSQLDHVHGRRWHVLQSRLELERFLGRVKANSEIRTDAMHAGRDIWTCRAGNYRRQIRDVMGAQKAQVNR